MHYKYFLSIVIFISSPALAEEEDITVTGTSFQKIGTIEENFRTHLKEYKTNKKINRDFNVYSNFYRYKDDKEAKIRFGSENKIYYSFIKDDDIFNEISKNPANTPIFSNIGDNYCLKSQVHFFLKGNYSFISYTDIISARKKLIADYKEIAPSFIVDIFFPNIENIRITIPPKSTLSYYDSNNISSVIYYNNNNEEYVYLMSISSIADDKVLFIKNGLMSVELGGYGAFVTDKMCKKGIF